MTTASMRAAGGAALTLTTRVAPPTLLPPRAKRRVSSSIRAAASPPPRQAQQQSPPQPQPQQLLGRPGKAATAAAAVSGAGSGSFDSFDSLDDDLGNAVLTTQAPAQRKQPWHLPALSPRARGLVLLNIMTVLMASNWSVLRDGATAATLTDGPTFMALRFAIAAAAFAPFLRRDPRIVSAGLKIGTAYSLGYVTQALALGATSASRASLLSTFTVLAVPVLAAMKGARIKPIVWACAAAALAGTAMLEGGSALGPPNAGDAWAVASAVFFAGQITIAEREMRALPKGSELPLMATAMAVVAAASALAAAAMHHQAGDLPAAAAGVAELAADWRAALLPAALGGGGAVPAAEAREAFKTLAQLIWTSVITTDAVLYAELVALQDVSSTDAAMTYSLEPVLGALIAYATLGERFGAWGWAGGALILVASVATQAAGATQAAEGGDGGSSSAK